MKSASLMTAVLCLGLGRIALGQVDVTESHPVLSWTSSNEKGVYGYIIYRAADADGPFLRVNSRIVAVGSTSGENAEAPGAQKSSYRYVDTTARPDQVHYYYIDAIAESGLQMRLTGTVRKAPKSATPKN